MFCKCKYIYKTENESCVILKQNFTFLSHEKQIENIPHTLNEFELNCM